MNVDCIVGFLAEFNHDFAIFAIFGTKYSREKTLVGVWLSHCSYQYYVLEMS